MKTDDDKVRAIHNYVVQNTRYLHVGLGIHGWKPYRTTTCFRNRYGDCKDKAALLKVMLEEAISACKRQNKYVGICGQGPSDYPDLAKWLLEQDIESMSLNPDTVVSTWLYLAGERV